MAYHLLCSTSFFIYFSFIAVCSLDCGPNGVCESGKCRCNPGYVGNLCDQLPCDPRCAEHGQCKNGTCVCSQGWNGRHCTLRKYHSIYNPNKERKKLIHTFFRRHSRKGKRNSMQPRQNGCVFKFLSNAFLMKVGKKLRETYSNSLSCNQTSINGSGNGDGRRQNGISHSCT